MSTRAVISRTTGHEGEFAGVYSHSDGYPSWLGKHLWQIIHVDYHGDLAAALKFLIDAHSAGWSVCGEVCYCHPSGHLKGREPESANPFTHKDVGKDSDIEWVYVFDEENNRLFVRDTGHDAEEIVELAGPEPDWSDVECGADLSRCHHYAWVHNLLPRTSNLSTRTYLGLQPLEFHDCIAFLINGKRYAATGSGGNSDYLNRFTKKPLPRSAWISTVKAANGRHLELPTAMITPSGYKPWPNVVWVYPPTKDQQRETLVSLKQAELFEGA